MTVQDLINASINSILSFFRVPDGAGGWFTVTQQEVIDTLNLATVPTSLKVVYTGTLPISFPPIQMLGTSAMSVITHSGDNAVTPLAGVSSMSNLSFTDSLGLLTTLEFTNLNSLLTPSSGFSPSGLANLTSLSLPELTYVGSSFNPIQCGSLTALSIPLLVFVGNAFSPGTMAALTTLSAPALAFVGGNFQPATMASLTTFSFPALKYIAGQFAPATMASLAVISLPNLQKIGGGSTVSAMASLTQVSLPSMVAYVAGLTASSGLGNLTTVTLGTIGTLKIGPSPISITGQKLDQASVNGILALLVSLDGTNGTTLWGAGKTVNLSGGTSAAPSGAGISDKATLVARGATVTTN